ncbi:MAG: UTP--glucose-1-phosphate uridylyltransferase [Lentisphaerae bacterium]|nr:UTP--glucose-1-phosphate uridylyltransferase [Lentisphaerota bacterium]
MKVVKAVITAAGKDQRALPLQTLVDRDGESKSALEIIVGEIREAGIDEIGVVIHPGDEQAFAASAGDASGSLRFIPQQEARGYGHALYCARDFVGSDAFLHVVSDHLAVSATAVRCSRQVVAVAEAEECAVSAVQATRENRLPYYGAVGGHPVKGKKRLYEIEKVLEKPTPTQAEQELIVPGLRAGYYLCYFGMHVITPSVMNLLERKLAEAGDSGLVQLSPALAELAKKERCLALDIAGQRYNIGIKYGLFYAQLALAMKGEDCEEVLAQLVEMLATRESADV